MSRSKLDDHKTKELHQLENEYTLADDHEESKEFFSESLNSMNANNNPKFIGIVQSKNQVPTTPTALSAKLDNDFPEPLILPTKLLVSKAQQNHHVDASPSISQQDKPRIPLEKILSDIDNDNNFLKRQQTQVKNDETEPIIDSNYEKNDNKQEDKKLQPVSSPKKKKIFQRFWVSKKPEVNKVENNKVHHLIEDKASGYVIDETRQRVIPAKQLKIRKILEKHAGKNAGKDSLMDILVVKNKASEKK